MRSHVSPALKEESELHLNVEIVSFKGKSLGWSLIFAPPNKPYRFIIVILPIFLKERD